MAMDNLCKIYLVYVSLFAVSCGSLVNAQQQVQFYPGLLVDKIQPAKGIFDAKFDPIHIPEAGQKVVVLQPEVDTKFKSNLPELELEPIGSDDKGAFDAPHDFPIEDPEESEICEECLEFVTEALIKETIMKIEKFCKTVEEKCKKDSQSTERGEDGKWCEAKGQWCESVKKDPKVGIKTYIKEFKFRPRMMAMKKCAASKKCKPPPPPPPCH